MRLAIHVNRELAIHGVTYLAIPGGMRSRDARGYILYRKLYQV